MRHEAILNKEEETAISQGDGSIMRRASCPIYLILWILLPAARLWAVGCNVQFRKVKAPSSLPSSILPYESRTHFTQVVLNLLYLE